MERGNTKQEILDALVQEVLEQYEGNMTPSFSAVESTHRAAPADISYRKTSKTCRAGKLLYAV